MSDLKLTDEEVAHVRARRELAAEAEKKRLAENRPIDLDDIKPGMSREEAKKAAEAISKAWGLTK